MFSTKNCECQFCSSKATLQLLSDAEHRIIECPLCGKYIDNCFSVENENKNILASYLFYNKKTDKEFNYIGDDRYFDFLKKDAPSAAFYKITPEIINTYKYMSFSEKINHLVLYL